MPSVVQTTVTVKLVPKLAETADTEQLAVPDALTKSDRSSPWTVSEKTTLYVKVRLGLSLPTLDVSVTVGATVSTAPPVRAEDANDSSPEPFALIARILIW